MPTQAKNSQQSAVHSKWVSMIGIVDGIVDTHLPPTADYFLLTFRGISY